MVLSQGIFLVMLVFVIIDDIRKALKQGLKKHWIEKWQKGQIKNEK